ncbi:SDR family NAD(P)-dependent oxidoreductase [Reinekea blandensis]|uniref:Dihydromonapterin reductase n=1 Tax=Reinekea blandensis MED297 TaxID=314283 RepID=A4BK61_9GAMM|nr:SDR family NAD(P)-dependent oxidoreductase [Reinekea blandensis]EAR07490.1 Short chain dehydrogenase/reductase family protein [Reinekea sp. MED297] [Reinekea blandensis MED297]
MPHLVVTGGSRRLGLEITRHFLNKGWQVSVLTRSASDELEQLSSSSLTVLKTGRYDADSITSAIQPLAESTVDLIVHNASLFEKDSADPEDAVPQIGRLMAVHVALPTLINTLLEPALRRSENANIVHMTDIYALNPSEDYSRYCASKAALENLSLSFAKKLAPHVRVNTIQPGALMFLPEHGDEAKNQVLEQSLLKIESGFDPVLKTLDYFIDNPFVTGTAVKVDGGRAISR